MYTTSLQEEREHIKYEIAYQTRPFIYNANFKLEEKTTQAMAWISFSNLLPIFFVKDSLFSLVSAVWKPIYLDTTTINKTRLVVQRFQVNLSAKLYDYVELEVQNSENNETKIQKVKIHYDRLPKYSHTSKFRGHLEDGGRSTHPELRQEVKFEQQGEEKKDDDLSDMSLQKRSINGKVVLAKWSPTSMMFTLEKDTTRLINDTSDDLDTTKKGLCI